MVIWSGIEVKPMNKLTLGGSIQTMSFNPITNALFAGSMKDVCLFQPDGEGSQQLKKDKVKDGVKACDWSPDGRFIAYGDVKGTIIISDSKLKNKKKFKALAPVTSVSWSPLTVDHPNLILLVATESKHISFHNEAGERYGFERKTVLEIFCISWFASGNYFLAGGSENLVCVFTREGLLLKKLLTLNDWVWGLEVDSQRNRFLAGTNDGEIMSVQIGLDRPRGYSKDKFATRVGLTEVLITDLNSDKKARFRCKELVNHISLFKQALAVELTTKVLIYEETMSIDSNTKNNEVGFSYTPIGKFKVALDSDFFLMASENFLSVKNNKIRCYDFEERVTMEWVLDTKITFVKLLAGPPRGENILVGTKKGTVYRVILNNPFPVALVQHGIAVQKADMSLMRKYLAIVDNQRGFYIYDLKTKEVLTSQLKIDYCAFNSEFDDMYAFSGDGLLFAKTLDY